MFELTKSQKEIQKAAREFAKGEFDKELAYELDKQEEFPVALWEKAAELGFIGIHFPEAYSGGEMGLIEYSLIIEELCRNDPSLGGALVQSSHAAECLVLFGSESQKTKYLPEIAEGRILSSGAFSESIRGNDDGDIESNAVKEGNQWLINGRKKHVTNAGQAGFYIVTANTADQDISYDKRQSMFLIEADNSGIELIADGKKLGNNLISTGELVLSNVSVSEENLVGKEGKGWNQLQSFLNENRIIAAAQALGTALASFDRMLEYVKGREQFGRKLAEFQVSQHKIADMATRIELSRLILHKAAWERDNKKTNSASVSMAKITASRTAMEVSSHAIQLYGGYGYMTEYEVERFFRDAKAMEVRNGTSDIQRDVIAKAVIGKIK
jgi:alkylation response protein AidB-like acyl-CoA dehydrogenase